MKDKNIKDYSVRLYMRCSGVTVLLAEYATDRQKFKMTAENLMTRTYTRVMQKLPVQV